MKLIRGAKKKHGRSPYAIVPRQRGENKFSKQAVREAPLFLPTKVQKSGHLIIRNFACFRFPRSVTAKFFLI